MRLALQRGRGVMIRKVERCQPASLLRMLGVPEREYISAKASHRRRSKHGSGTFYHHNAGRLEYILWEANRAWKRKVRAIGDVSLCRAINDIWNRLKHLLLQAMNPRMHLHG